MKRLLLILFLCTQAQAVTSIINAFNSGELSPMTEGRTDIRKYYSGCRTLENMYVLPYGGVSKRPGTYYVASAKSGSVRCRVIPFEYSTTQAYIIEAGNLYMRFYRNGGQILDAGSPYEIVTPYLTADLLELQFIQSADVMYIVHNDYAPRKLTRTGHTAWTLTEADFQRGPFRKENTTATTITPSGTTGTITLTASTAIFDADHVGALWQVIHTVPADSTSGTFTATGNSVTVTAQYNRIVTWTTHGNWDASLALQRSYDGGSNWTNVFPQVSYDDGNISWREPETVADAIYRVNCSAYAATFGPVRYTLTAEPFDVEGVVDITAYSVPDNGTVVTGTVDYTLGGTGAVTTWAEGAWSPYRGYPSSIAFYEERVAYGGTTSDPQTVWLSQTRDWENFLAGGDDTDALEYTFASDQVNAIRWMIPQNALLIGTMGAEWKLSAEQANQPLSQNNYAVKRQSTYGSAALQAVAVNNHILFAQRQARKIRQLKYSFELDTWIAPDITILSEHITESGIVDTAFQKTPQPILWCVRDDGVLIGLSYEEDQQVIGWHRHPMDGEVESVAVISGTAEDEVWLSIKRTIDSSDVRYIEQMQPFNWGTDQNDVFFVDSGLTFEGAGSQQVYSVHATYPLYISTIDTPVFVAGDQVRVTGTGITEIDDQVFTVWIVSGNLMGFSTADNSVVVDATGWDFADFDGRLGKDNHSGIADNAYMVQVENTFTTLTHLEGETITICGEGGYEGADTVASGTVTLDYFYDKVHIGLPYTAKLKPMKLEFPNTQGLLQGRTKRITATTLRLYKSLGCDVGPTFTTYDSFVFRDADDPLELPPPLFTGDKKELFRGGYETAGDICIQQSLPLPLSVLAVIVEYEVYD